MTPRASRNLLTIFVLVQGTDIAGTLGYAGLWAGANVLVAFAYAWLGNEQ